jgi:hypothetical protein
VSSKTHGRTKFGAEMFTFLVGDTASHGHGHGKTTPVFDRGETASLFGIVIPLSYLCIVMEMARQTNKGKARQVSSKTQSLTEMMRTHQGKASQTQGKASHTTADGSRFYLELSYLCRTFVSLN